MFIGVAGFAVHLTVRIKDLGGTSKLAKQKSTTAFLSTVLLMNLCDFLRLFLTSTIGMSNLEWIYVAENVLEVAVVYTVIFMEKEYLGKSMPKFSKAFFALVAMLILYLDVMHDWGGNEKDKTYFVLMILINLPPIIMLATESVLFCKETESPEKRRTNGYIGDFTGLCVFLCVICTMSNADQQMRHRFFLHSEEIYEVIWLIFNVTTYAFIWKTINNEDPVALIKQISLEEKLTTLKRDCKLSDREVEIARFIYEGKNNKDIASAMYLSPNTIKVHASNLYRKIGAENRVQAVQIMAGEMEPAKNDKLK